MMHIRITGKQIVIGEALPHRVRERVSAAVEKHFDRDAETNVRAESRSFLTRDSTRDSITVHDVRIQSETRRCRHFIF